jgi:hypothetical protein
MDKEVDKIIKNSEELEERLELIVNETACYKATREELSGINSDIKKLLEDVENAITGYKDFEKTKNNLIESYNKNTSIVLEEIELQKREIKILSEENKLFFNQQKEEYHKIIKNLDSQIRNLKKFGIGMVSTIVFNLAILIILMTS